MARAQSKVLSVGEIKTAKAEATTLVKTAQVNVKAANAALAASRKTQAATKAAFIKAHDLAVKAMDKQNAIDDTVLAKTALDATKSLEAANKALAKATPQTSASDA